MVAARHAERRYVPARLPARRVTQPFDNGYRPHQIEIWPDRPDRAYVAYIDGGGMIFDISELAEVASGRRDALYASPAGSRAVPSTVYGVDTHVSTDVHATARVGVGRRHGRQLQGRTETGLAARHSRGNQPPDHRTAPLHADDGRMCKAAAASAPTTSIRTSRARSTRLENTTVATWFNGGIRLFRAVEARAVCQTRRRTSKRSASTFRRRRPATRTARFRSITRSWTSAA